MIVYLRSLDPVRNPLPVTKLPAGREPLVAPEPLDGPVPAPNQSTPIARGVVRAASPIADVTSCEAPLNPGFFGGGNQMAIFGRPAVFSANLSPAPSGIGSYYDEALFREVLHTGALRGRSLSDVMPWSSAIRN